MLCCGRKKDSRHAIAQRLAGSTSAFLTHQPTLYPQQQYVLANQSPYGTIGVQQQLNLQQQQIQQQNVALQQAQQQNAALQQAVLQQQTNQLQNVVTSTPNTLPPNSNVQTKSVHFLNANIPNAQPIYSNALNSPANSGIYGQIRANPLANQLAANRQLMNRPGGISNDVYRQIEAVENNLNQLNIQNLDAVEKRGEMLISILDPRTLGRDGSEAGAKYLQNATARGLQQSIQFIEIIKRPGQTLGLYIREKDNQTNLTGVFISKLEPDSPLYNSGLLHVGDEILAVNLVDVAGMSVDDVVILMSIPRRLVLTIRTNNLSRLASNQLNQQIQRAMNNGDYVQLAQLQAQLQQQQQSLQQNPPIVVLKKELGQDDLMYDEEERRNLLGNQLAQIVGGNVVVGNDEVVVNGNMILYEDPYGRIGLRPRDETNWVNRNQFVVGGKTPFAPFAVTQQPGNMRRNLLNESSSIYGTIDHTATALLNRPASRLLANKLQTRASIHRPPTSLSNTNSPLRRPGSRLLHAAESDNRLMGAGLNPTISDYFLEQITRPSSRLSSLGLNADYSHMLNRRRLAAGLNQSLSTQGLSTMLRRRSTIGGMPTNGLLFNRPIHPRSRSRLMMSDTTGSDSEIGAIHRNRPASALAISSSGDYSRGSGYRSFFDRYNQPLPPSARYMLESGRASAMSFRSNSLPRHHQKPLDFHFPLHGNSMISGASASKLRRPGSSQVRFDKHNTYYNSTYDEDSDGLDEMKAKNHLARRENNASYSDWLTRAPSTSALYETVRKRSTLPSVSSAGVMGGASGLKAVSINKIAQSAENLIETIKNEQQKSLLDSPYFKASVPELPPRPGIATLASPHKTKKRDLPMTNKLALNNKLFFNKSNISSKSSSHYQPDTLQRTIPNPTPVKPSEDERMHLLTLNPREFFKYKYEKSLANSRDNMDQLNELNIKPYSGLLYIHLLAGRGLRSQITNDLTSTVSTNPLSTYRDLYCVIECDRSHKARTVVRSGETSFDWDEKFELDLFEVKEISFLLYSWDPQFKHKLCYKGVINLSNLNLEQNLAHSLALKMDGKGKGTLYLKMVYSELRICYARRQYPNKLFGGDLEMIVARENRGLNVPLIVKRCAEEIENRGMDLIGIYRICGSQVRKNLLKDAFENNSHLVELGVDHVPDINVLTSLLKDYLRELPQPLFAKALFEMMIDGFSVCLPDDAAGNAKLMFSILECLPKINRCTVLFLMDHLKLTVNNSERNKMTSQQIAIIFGPLFTCTDNDSFNLRKTIEVFKFLIDIWPSKKETSILDSMKMNNQLAGQTTDFSGPNSMDKSNLLGEQRRRLLSSELSLEREKERLRGDEKDLMNRSMIESNTMNSSSAHLFNSNQATNLQQQQHTSQSSTNLNSLSGYNKPFSYHLPNNRDFNFNSTNISPSTNLTSASKSNTFNPSSSLLHNSSSAISSSVNQSNISNTIGTGQLSGLTNTQLATATSYNSNPPLGDSGVSTGSGGSGRNTGSSSNSTSRYSNSSNSTMAAVKKSVGWANQETQSPTKSRNNSLIGTSMIGQSSVLGNTTSSLMNSSLIGNSSNSASKYSSDYLNDKYTTNDSYASPSRYNYSSSILEDSKSRSSNVVIGTSSLIDNLGDTSSKYSSDKYSSDKYSDLNETNKKSYDSYR